MTDPQPPQSGSSGGTSTEGGHPHAESPTPTTTTRLAEPEGGHPHAETEPSN